MKFVLASNNQKKLTEMGFTPLPTWQDALKRYLKEIEE